MARRKKASEMSVAQLERLLERRRREARIEPLKRERARLLRRLKKIERKIERLKGGAPASRRKKPGRKTRKISAAARRKMSLAKKQWWAKKKAQAV